MSGRHASLPWLQGGPAALLRYSASFVQPFGGHAQALGAEMATSRGGCARWLACSRFQDVGHVPLSDQRSGAHPPAASRAQCLAGAAAAAAAHWSSGDPPIAPASLASRAVRSRCWQQTTTGMIQQSSQLRQAHQRAGRRRRSPAAAPRRSRCSGRRRASHPSAAPSAARWAGWRLPGGDVRVRSLIAGPPPG